MYIGMYLYSLQVQAAKPYEASACSDLTSGGTSVCNCIRLDRQAPDRAPLPLGEECGPSTYVTPYLPSKQQ